MLTSTQYLGFRSVSTVLLTVKLLSTVIALLGKARSNDDMTKKVIKNFGWINRNLGLRKGHSEIWLEEFMNSLVI